MMIMSGVKRKDTREPHQNCWKILLLCSPNIIQVMQCARYFTLVDVLRQPVPGNTIRHQSFKM